MTETPSQALARLMTEQGLSSRKLAAAAEAAGHKLLQSTIVGLNSGKQVFTLATAQACAAALGASAALFLPELAELGPASAPMTDPDLLRLDLAVLAPSHLNPRRDFDAAFDAFFAGFFDRARSLAATGDLGSLVDLLHEPDSHPKLRELAGLADSIRAKGLLQNLVVRLRPEFVDPLGYWIVTGERRYRALDLLCSLDLLPPDLAQHGIPCRLVEIDDAEHIAIALLENIQRQDVQPLDEAHAFAQLQDTDPARWTPAYIAQRIGMTTRHVQLRLRLARHLAPEVKAKLTAGEIKLAEARVLATLPAAVQTDLIASNRLYLLHGHGPGLAEAANRKMPMVSLASFPVAGCGLEISIDPETGERRFTDAAAFRVLQRSALDQLADRLRADEKPAFVDVLEDYFPSYDYPGGGTGIVVLLARDGSVEIKRGLRKAAGAATNNPAARARHAAKHAFENEAWRAANDFRAALAEALTIDDALRLIVANGVIDYDHAPLGSGRLTVTLPMLEHEDGALNPVNDIVKRDKGKVGADMLTALWRFIETLPASDNATGLNLLILEMVGAALAYPFGKPLHPILRSIAQKRGVAIPDILLLEGKAKKEEIARGAEALLSAAGDPPAPAAAVIGAVTDDEPEPIDDLDDEADRYEAGAEDDA